MFTFLASCYNCDKYQDEVYKEDAFQIEITPEDEEWYNERLEAWGEPDMKSLSFESYGVIVLHSFRKDTSLIIRLENNKSNYQIFLKKLTKDGASLDRVVTNNPK